MPILSLCHLDLDERALIMGGRPEFVELRL